MVKTVVEAPQEWHAAQVEEEFGLPVLSPRPLAAAPPDRGGLAFVIL